MKEQVLLKTLEKKQKSNYTAMTCILKDLILKKCSLKKSPSWIINNLNIIFRRMIQK